MKFLVTGATGMLGSAFMARLPGAIAADRVRLQTVQGIASLLDEVRPDIVINCAADVDAERAEHDPDPAFFANSMMPGLLAGACRTRDVLLVHFSSTGCYGRAKSEPYTEEDRLEPTTVHHRSKASGEMAVLASGCRSLILRTGWLFGGQMSHKKNFVWKRILEARGARAIQSDTSQVGCPTFVDDVVEMTLKMISVDLTGTFNCVSQGRATRYEYVSQIIQAAGIDCVVEPVGAFKRLAPISPNESALNYRLHLLSMDTMPHWREAISTYVNHLRGHKDWSASTSGVSK